MTRLLANLASKTQFVATFPLKTVTSSVSRAAVSAAAASSHSHGSSHEFAPSSIAFTAKYSGAQLSATTKFCGSHSNFIQKRGYVSPANVSTASSVGDLSNAPTVNSEYLKDLKNYDDEGSRNFAYFMVGTFSAVNAMMAKNIVSDYIVNLSASADVLALAKVEIDMAAIPEGKNVIVKWRGKPIFVRHRTAEEIKEAESVSIAELRHKETDAERVQKPEWLVMLGVCTHLGCVPIGEAGDYGGWFCPCHGSHYDISGRIRKGPAPLNLEIPEYTIDEASNKIVIG